MLAIQLQPPRAGCGDQAQAIAVRDLHFGLRSSSLPASKRGCATTGETPARPVPPRPHRQRRLTRIATSFIQQRARVRSTRSSSPIGATENPR